MAKKLDLTIDIQMAENGGIVCKYFDRDEDKDDSPMEPGGGQKTYTFKSAKEALTQISKWLTDEETEEKNEVPQDKESVKAHLHNKNIGTTMRAMKGEGY